MSKYIVTVTIEIDVPEPGSYDYEVYQRSPLGLPGTPSTDAYVAAAMAQDYLVRGSGCTGAGYVTKETITAAPVEPVIGCQAVSNDDWLCTLSADHDGQHEAHVSHDATVPAVQVWGEDATDAEADANDFEEGSLEWHAWGMGYAFAQRNAPMASPLAGEWAGDPDPREAVAAAWVAVMGPSWDTYVDGSESDRDEDEAILDAWEQGARHAWRNV